MNKFSLISIFCFLFSPLANAFVMPEHNESIGELSGSASVTPDGLLNYTLPIDLPSVPGGMKPNISLSYNGTQQNGIMGMGWQLNASSKIHRCPATPEQDGRFGSVNFDSNDRFCLDGQRLVLTSGSYGSYGSEYRLEHNPQVKIEYTNTFTVRRANGITQQYGGSYGAYDQETISTSNGSRNAYAFWHLSSETDLFNNTISYRYNSLSQQENTISQTIYGKYDHSYTVSFEYHNQYKEKADYLLCL